jgi:hypothetical protein
MSGFAGSSDRLVARTGGIDSRAGREEGSNPYAQPPAPGLPDLLSVSSSRSRPSFNLVRLLPRGVGDEALSVAKRVRHYGASGRNDLGGTASAAGGSGNPEWYLPQNHVSAVGDVLARVLSGRLRQPSPVNAGTSCPAEASSASDVQVNCRAEDDGSPQNTQGETTVVAVGNKVVAGFNDSLVCCVPAI